MNYNNIMPYYHNNMYKGNPVRQVAMPQNVYRSGDRLIGPGGFLFPFALGFISSPLVYNATRPRPVYYPPVYRPYPYYY